MKLVICICTYNRNYNLIKCLKSINKLQTISGIKIEILVVDNSIRNTSFKKVKKIKKSIKYKIFQLHEKKRGVVNARNRCLKEVRKINPKFMCFFDDDCIIDRFWLKNVFKVKKLTNAGIVTGPQLHLKRKSFNKSKLINYSKLFEKNYKNNIKKVYWAANNNVFLNYDIIKKSGLIFDKTFNKFGMGEDQLFFLKLTSLGHSIYWSKNVKVFEDAHEHRLNVKWVITRSFRLGVLGHYIDTNIYGAFIGLVINYLKSIYYFIKGFSYVLLVFNKKFQAQIFNYFSRFYGRLIGPFVIKKINFLK